MQHLIRFQKVGSKKVQSEITTKNIEIVREVLAKYGYHILHSCEYSEGDAIKILNLRKSR